MRLDLPNHHHSQYALPKHVVSFAVSQLWGHCSLDPSCCVSGALISVGAFCACHTPQRQPAATLLNESRPFLLPPHQFRGISLDIVYARLMRNTIDEDLDISNNKVLSACDEQTVRSLNGCRVTDTILRMVPDVETFRVALRAIKHWASRRYMYLSACVLAFCMYFCTWVGL